MSIEPAELGSRAAAMAGEYVPRQIGARHIEVQGRAQGRDWLFWPLALPLGLALARGVQLASRKREVTPAFAWYLVGVGGLSAVGYALTRPTAGETIDRYMLLTVFGPVGIVALFLTLEPVSWLRRAGVVLAVGWAAMSGVDHLHLLDEYRNGRSVDEAQIAADELVVRGIEVAAADYWDAYRLTFLSGERVKIASTGVSRVTRYGWLAQQEGDRLILLSREPCASDQPPIRPWYLCRAGTN
jgi:hypothetical protein